VAIAAGLLRLAPVGCSQGCQAWEEREDLRKQPTQTGQSAATEQTQIIIAREPTRWVHTQKHVSRFLE